MDKNTTMRKCGLNFKTSTLYCAFQLAWAPGMGVKNTEYKDLWNVDLGCTYIPWDSLPADLSQFLEGGVLDEESLPSHLKGNFRICSNWSCLRYSSQELSL